MTARYESALLPTAGYGGGPAWVILDHHRRKVALFGPDARPSTDRYAADLNAGHYFALAWNDAGYRPPLTTTSTESEPTVSTAKPIYAIRYASKDGNVVRTELPDSDNELGEYLDTDYVDATDYHALVEAVAKHNESGPRLIAELVEATLEPAKVVPKPVVIPTEAGYYQHEGYVGSTNQVVYGLNDAGEWHSHGWATRTHHVDTGALESRIRSFGPLVRLGAVK